MFESVREPVDVLTAFVDGRVRPLRFRRGGRVIPIRRVNGHWTRREGQTVLLCFSVEGPADENFELCYDPRAPRWTLTRVWSGGESGGRTGDGRGTRGRGG
jgi:hypothetical protein